MFLTQLNIKWPFNFFLPHPRTVSALPGKRKTNRICDKMNKKTSKTYLTL